MGNSVAPSHSTECLEGQSQSFRFRSLISRKGAELGHIIIKIKVMAYTIKINNKSYMGSAMHHQIWSWMTLKG